MSCPACGYDYGEEYEPTAEEMAAERERALVRLAERMVPARTPVEQANRDMDAAMDHMARSLAMALYGDDT